MANICKNEIFVSFNTEGVAKEQKIKFLKEFSEAFEILTDLDDMLKQLEEYNSVEISFSSKWTAPVDKLKDYCDKYNLKIIGIAYEWGNAYVDHFELS